MPIAQRLSDMIAEYKKTHGKKPSLIIMGEEIFTSLGSDYESWAKTSVTKGVKSFDGVKIKPTFERPKNQIVLK